MDRIDSLEVQTLKAELNGTFNDFIGTISLFKEEEIDVIPFEGSWTAGQVAEHVIKSLQSFPSVISGNRVAPDRAPDEMKAAIRDLFLDFNAKFNSPESVFPTAQHHDKNEILETLAGFKDQITAAADMDLSLLSMAFEFPGFGYLTILEWLTFFAVHTQRHTRQLRNIYQALKQ